MTNIVDRERLKRELNPEQLIKDAQAFTGLSEFEDNNAFVEPLTRLVEACIEEGDFSEAGLEGFKSDAQRVLVNKLRMQKDLAQHPDILEQDVSDPIIVIGMMRTGTTKLQRDLAADPDLRSIPFWEILYPSRFPNEERGDRKTRRDYAISSGGVSGHDIEDTQNAHKIDMDLADEDIWLFENSFESIYYYLRNKVPSYYQWLKGRSPRPAYASYKKIIQYLQWQDGGKGGGKNKTWILKSTSHVGELEALFEQFPNATVVHAHRDPVASIASSASLQEPSWEVRGDPGSKPFIGKTMLELWSEQMQRCLEARERLGSSVKIVDIAYKDICRDVLSVIKEIYCVHGQELSAEAVESITAWGNNNQQHKWGEHKYNLQDFSLSKEMVDEVFSDYIEQFSQLIY